VPYFTAELRNDVADPDLRIILPVALRALVLLLALELEHQNLVAAILGGDGRIDARIAGNFSPVSNSPPSLKSASTLPSATSAPTSAFSLGTRITSPGATRNCFPPVSIIACIKERPMQSKKPGRRGFLKNSAKLAGLAAGGTGVSKAAEELTNTSKPKGYMSDEQIAYGERSHYVTSKRLPVMGRHSPDEYGLMFHVLTPLQDSVGIITPSSLFYLATHRGAYIPDIDPKEHRLMIHGMVDRPLIFTMDDIKRLPSVSRVHMIECLGNRASGGPHHGAANAWTDQLRGMDRCGTFTAAQGSRRAARRILGHR
jgi:hypothetical protein